MLFYHRFSGFPSSFLRNTHACSPPYLSLPSFVFILMPESRQHVRFVYNGNLTLPSWLMLRLRARTDLKTRGWQPSGLQSQFNLAKAQREFSLPFAAPLRFLPLSRAVLLWWWQRRWLRSGGPDWFNYGTDEPARREQKSSVILHGPCAVRINATVITSQAQVLSFFYFALPRRLTPEGWKRLFEVS